MFFDSGKVFFTLRFVKVNYEVVQTVHFYNYAHVYYTYNYM